MERLQTEGGASLPLVMACDDVKGGVFGCTLGWVAVVVLVCLPLLLLKLPLFLSIG